MSDRANLVRVLTASTGMSTMTLGAAYSQLFMTSAEANMADGHTYTYLIVDGNNWEMGKGVYTASGTTLSRVTVLASRISGTIGTTKITLSGTAQVRIIESADDMDAIRGTRTVTGTTDTLAQTDLGHAVAYSNATGIAVSLAQAGASSQFLDGWCVWVKNTGAGTVTITPTTSTIGGASNLQLAQTFGAFIWSDGTNYHQFTIPLVRALLAVNNLSDVANAATARGNLGIAGIVASCGRFSFTSATAVKFLPFNGDLIKINGALFQIPSAGIAGVANTSVFVNGTGASNLAASTLYYVYAFNNSGTITADFSTTSYATSGTAGNVGTMIKSGDDTRTLIGMVFTNASSQFVDAQTISWFNRRRKVVKTPITANSTITASSFTEFNTSWRAQFVTWAEEAVQAQFTGTAFLTTSSDNAITAVAFDGTTPSDSGVSQSNATFALTGASADGFETLTDGNHYATVVGKQITGSGGLTIAGSATSGQRGVVSVWFMG